MVARTLALVGLALAFASCAFPVEGKFIGSPLGGTRDPRQTILIIFNHGFSSENYETHLQPLIERVRAGIRARTAGTAPPAP